MICQETPDEVTQRSMEGQVTERMSGEYLDVLPARWLVWHGGGILGPPRYACAKHRGELTAYLRFHYGALSTRVWNMPPYTQRWPEEARENMGGVMAIPKFGFRGDRLLDSGTPRWVDWNTDAQKPDAEAEGTAEGKAEGAAEG